MKLQALSGLVVLSLGVGCAGELELGGGPEGDARLTADVYTWACSNSEDSRWEGVYAFTVALEYAPDGVQNRELPAPGECTGELSMFPEDAGVAGANIPNLEGEPGWKTTTSEGVMMAMASGFWYHNVLDQAHTCYEPGDLVTSGIQLTDAASLSGATTPKAGTLGTVEVLSDGGDGLSFGEEATVSWESSGWDETWVQVRMEREGEAWGTVTCNTSGMDSLVLDDTVWSHLNGDLNVEYINLYAGFQNRGLYEAESGIKVETVTRAIHVEVVNEI